MRDTSASTVSGSGPLLVLITVLILLGLVGHDPWKQDETYIFGAVQHLIESRDWVVPVVAGEPFMEKPPLYYWVAGWLSQMFYPWLPLHDGARLASGFFMGITSLATGLHARKLWGSESAIPAVLLLIGCLGTLLYAHVMVTDIAVMTGFALCLVAFPFSLGRPLVAGILLGSGLGVGFLGKGLLLPGVMAISCGLLPALCRSWRTTAYVKTLSIAFLVSLPAFLIWPIALYVRAPALFDEWFWMNNVGRFVGFSVEQLGAPHTTGYWWTTLPWFAFPALPLAMLTLWQRRRELLRDIQLQPVLICSVVFMLTLAVAASARESYALPLVVGLSLIGAPSARALPRAFDVAWSWCSGVGFGIVAALVWAIWLSVLLGQPPTWRVMHQLVVVAPSDRKAVISLGRAAILTASILYLCIRHRRYQMTGLITWVSGLTLCWGLLVTLWMPWIDSAKSYRLVFTALSKALPQNHGCITSTGLGESERAMLHYFSGIDTLRSEVVPDPGCAFHLIEGLADAPPNNAESNYGISLWEGAREHDDRERFWLFGKAQSPSP